MRECRALSDIACRRVKETAKGPRRSRRGPFMMAYSIFSCVLEKVLESAPFVVVGRARQRAWGSVSLSAMTGQSATASRAAASDSAGMGMSRPRCRAAARG
ncbi:hypothetical protein GCM10022287_04560 [Gryllotalpicola koreensis]|uniref:Uncharacterized protein n=1 Tax=Gryllotalpicola koreensis TaxID=993086 RepID=A0ABP7ZSH6_9MICO